MGKLAREKRAKREQERKERERMDKILLDDLIRLDEWEKKQRESEKGVGC